MLFAPISLRIFFILIVTLVCAQNSQASKYVKTLGTIHERFQNGEFDQVEKLSEKLKVQDIRNPDYLLYFRAQSQYFQGHFSKALDTFRALAKIRSSRFFDLAYWRIADTLWQLERKKEASRQYQKALDHHGRFGDGGVAYFRIAEEKTLHDSARAIEKFKDYLRKYPGHYLHQKANEHLVKLGDGGLAALSVQEHIERSILLIQAKKWEIALQELSALDVSQLDAITKRRHLYWLSMAMFKRRRHYEKAGRNFLSIYTEMGDMAAKTLFYGARAMSRADFDSFAIKKYQLLVKKYPHSKWAAEAQFLSGWLEFNRGSYEKALSYLSIMSKKYTKSPFAGKAPWYLGMSYFQLDKFAKALPYFKKIAKKSGKEVGGKGRYWVARSLQKLERLPEANVLYRTLIQDYPFSWYALLSISRLEEQGETMGVFGKTPAKFSNMLPLDTSLSKKILSDPYLLDAEELLNAGMANEAGVELRRGERAFLKRHRKKKSSAMSALFFRYKKAGNFNRPWMLAVVHGGRRALNVEPKGVAKIWWKHAYPKAYESLVETYRKLSGFPDYYLYTIMRKESGFNPNTHSYADAQGLLQMIPPTTEKVVSALGIAYTEDLLFDPEKNIKVGAWYISRLLKKFGNQIPIGAGSYNGGPRAMMRWLKKHKGKPMDEFVELATYSQTRKYMKRTTETYARYKYLYDSKVYKQPLDLDTDFLVDEIDY